MQAFSGLVKDLNTTTRCSGLPLGGNNGDTTFAQVATWQAGFPTRISLANGCPHFDPIQNNWERLLESGEADILRVGHQYEQATEWHTRTPDLEGAS